MSPFVVAKVKYNADMTWDENECRFYVILADQDERRRYSKPGAPGEFADEFVYAPCFYSAEEAFEFIHYLNGGSVNNRVSTPEYQFDEWEDARMVDKDCGPLRTIGKTKI